MAQPPIYERKKDFIEDYDNETDHSAINNELDGAATSINAIRDNLSLIQRDDGGLKNGIVTADSIETTFKNELSAEINAKLGVDFSKLSLGQYFKEAFLVGADYAAGSSTQITLEDTPSSKANTSIYFDGVLQHQTEYELVGNVITFNVAIPVGVAQIEVGFANTLSEGLLGAESVATSHLSEAIFSGLTQVTAQADDYIPLADTSNGGAKRKALVSSVLAQIPIGTVTAAMLSDSVANDLALVSADILDSIVIADASDSGKKKKALVSSILNQQPAGSINSAHLSDSIVADLTSVPAAAGDSVFISDVSDGGKKRRALISSVITLIQSATTSEAGILPLATAAESLAGVVTNKAVTPWGLNWPRAFSTNGYQKLPGTPGLIIQWGQSANQGNIGNSSVLLKLTFPIAFPGAVLGVVPIIATSDAFNVQVTVNWKISDTTLSQAAFLYDEYTDIAQSSVYVTYFAIGY